MFLSLEMVTSLIWRFYCAPEDFPEGRGQESSPALLSVLSNLPCSGTGKKWSLKDELETYAEFKRTGRVQDTLTTVNWPQHALSVGDSKIGLHPEMVLI